METIDFWTPKGTYGFLSNFYNAPMAIQGVTYPTNEHFFQSQKFIGNPEERYIINLPTPAETARDYAWIGSR
ncbi:NADAR family protein (plasmid) [Aneurinibacillus sp. Ricciae_BoGa-3]|uniref:NADAR family protein n=1 Tax=Aneurinibacillus sp. Ricciae_BoGa-3 TaxID=3022697 RepID=UPI002341FBB3|nr:NADAR family protein [Aneurinibacillus sp. Ricciae_BoGa-3]WCK57013.1 NADAR family protein [Aneurinibacillus sp. Ricciae_BoGa-3]